MLVLMPSWLTYRAALLATLFALAIPLLVLLVDRGNPALSCVEDAHHALLDDASQPSDMFLVAEIRSKFAHCLVRSNVDVRTVPDFDVLFPGVGLGPLE